MPPLCRETQSLGQQMFNAPFGINGLRQLTQIHLVVASEASEGAKPSSHKISKKLICAYAHVWEAVWTRNQNPISRNSKELCFARASKPEITLANKVGFI